MIVIMFNLIVSLIVGSLVVVLLDKLDNNKLIGSTPRAIYLFLISIALTLSVAWVVVSVISLIIYLGEYTL